MRVHVHERLRVTVYVFNINGELKEHMWVCVLVCAGGCVCVWMSKWPATMTTLKTKQKTLATNIPFGKARSCRIPYKNFSN